MRPTPLLILLVLSAGCAQPLPTEPQVAPLPRPEGAPTPWNLTAHARLGLHDSVATPFVSVDGRFSDDTCYRIYFDVPADTALVQLTLPQAPVNTTRATSPGLGNYVLLLRDPKGELTQHTPPDAADADITVHVERPQPGRWGVGVFAWYASVNQIVHLQIVETGHGPHPDTIQLTPYQPDDCKV